MFIEEIRIHHSAPDLLHANETPHIFPQNIPEDAHLLTKLSKCGPCFPSLSFDFQKHNETIIDAHTCCRYLTGRTTNNL